MEGISGILLTGGKSTRMGTDKASLPFGNGTLLTVQLEKFRALGITDVLISGYGDGQIPDDVPGCGPLGGLAACLPRVQNPCALVISVPLAFFGGIGFFHRRRDIERDPPSEGGFMPPICGTDLERVLPASVRGILCACSPEIF